MNIIQYYHIRAICLVISAIPVFIMAISCDNNAFKHQIQYAPTHIIPYKKNEKVENIRLNWSSHKRLARGSDNWPTTWAADDYQYTAFGDGVGFEGCNKKGRVSLGLSRILGPDDQFSGQNLWGGIVPTPS